jgi:hypothetical protein
MAISLKTQLSGATRLQSRVWTIWWVLLICVAIPHLLTLTISPTVWLDEVNTIEFGRLTLEPNSDWSLFWAGRPLLLFNYLGSTIQELAFRASRFSIIGPRLVSLLSGFLASTALFGYLLARRIPQRLSFFLSALFLLEPMFVQSYRGGRVDGLAIAMCLFACWLLRVAINRGQNGKNITKLVALAGGLAAVGQFMWISALLLYPLIFIEFLELLQRSRGYNRGRFVSRQVLALLLGGITASVILMVPILPHLGTLLSDVMTLSKNNETIRDRSNILGEISKMAAAVVTTYKLNPLLLPAVGLGMVLSRDRKMILMTLAMIGLVLVTIVYQFRCIYLLPYFLCLMAEPFQLNHPTTRQNSHRLLAGLLLIVFLWGASLSLIVRPVLALNQRTGRSPDILHDAGMVLVGTGDHTVYLDTPELYYAGRALGWKMYKLIGIKPADIKASAEVQSTREHTGVRGMELPAIEHVVGIPNQFDATATQVAQTFGLNKQSSFKSKFAQTDTSVTLGAKPYDSFISFHQ